MTSLQDRLIRAMGPERKLLAHVNVADPKPDASGSVTLIQARND